MDRARRRLAALGLLAAGAPLATHAAPDPATTAPGRASPAPTPAGPAAPATAPAWDPVHPGPMRFPQDFGAHPGHRTEWWYATGWLERPGAADCGMQLTFFRSRTAHPDANPSRFAPRQLVLAHAALALPERGRLLHAERSARAGFGLAGAEPGDTRVWIDGGAGPWSLARDAAADRYAARVMARDFAMDLAFAPPGPPLPQGEGGFSRKGPGPLQASRYYSRPQLAVSGTIEVEGARTAVGGRAWFDHEWSSEILGADAPGWDWTGINLDDGGALMAFRIRRRDGGLVWRDATLREGPDGPVRTGLAPVFEPLRTWRSVRSGASWPVSMRVRVAGRDLELRPLFDDQELDARGSTGTTYWEGAVTAYEGGRRVGRGYLELTGYAGALRL
ncbi:MAG TPA: lipocalin-like domain-containing protein [Burkholderiaceae bacterium]|nr:lipocalin-like domain-containing protein [Burkholderiaceae bacterium]